jgi:LuxR family maltose regulon positive regulatory protein
MSFILKTKVSRPQLNQHQFVLRGELIDKIKAGLSRKLTVLSAPAGYGKTTLLCQWIDQIQIPAAWYSVDRSDQDCVQFFTYLIHAVQTVHPDVGQDALKQLQAQSMSHSYEYILGSLLNEIFVEAKELLLVIDDYHLIQSKDVHDNLLFFIEHLPARMHIFIATRSDPPLMLARLRSRNQMVEVRAGELAFNLNDTALFLNKIMHLDIPDLDVEKLNKRTEGWIAGLQMAAISLQKSSDRSEFVDSFASSHRYVMDYLIEEVFSCQPETVQTFLLRTSILNRMNAAVCNALTNQEDGQEMLESLDQANLFIIPLDEQRRWYRYHHLFAGLLKKHLQRKFPESINALHLQASLAFEKQGKIMDAVEHAIKSETFERAETLVSGIAEALWSQGRLGTLLNWAQCLPASGKTKHPKLYAIIATCVSLDGRFDQAGSYLRSAERNLDDHDQQVKGMIAAVRAYISDYRGDIESTEKFGNHALANLDDAYAAWRCLASLATGDCHVQRGPLGPATKSYQEAMRTGTMAGNRFYLSLAQHRYAVMLQRRGRLQKAMQSVEQYLSEDNSTGHKSGALNLVSGELLYERNRLEEAAEQVKTSLKLCTEQRHAAALPYCRMQLARIHLAQGEQEEAREEIEAGMEGLTPKDIAPWVESFVIAWKMRFHLMRGELALAEEMLQHRKLHIHGVFTYPNSSEYLVFARYLIQKGDFKDGLQLLQRLIDRLFSIDWRNLAYEAQLVQALAYSAAGQMDEALKGLSSVLEVAEPEGYRRLFMDEGEALRQLLQQSVQRGIHPGYIGKILFEADHVPGREKPSVRTESTALVEPLSDRELQVLRLLNSHLSSTEIAQELFISSNTVRTHIKRIYSKLNVHNRRGAVEKGLKVGLI